MTNFVTFLALTAFAIGLVRADNHMAPLVVSADETVCLEGYLMDFACANANFLMDKKMMEGKDVPALTCPGPAIHSFLCMLNEACYESGYALLKKGAGNEFETYVDLQNSRELVKAELIKIGGCNETAADCKDSTTSGFYATEVCGHITAVGKLNTMHVESIKGESRPDMECEAEPEAEMTESSANMIVVTVGVLSTLVAGLYLW